VTQQEATLYTDEKLAARPSFQQTVEQATPPPPTFSSSATINAQFWLEQLPWRPTAAWTVLAALLAIGLDTLTTLDWRTALLVLLLVDPLWGSIWRLAAGREETLPLQQGTSARPIWLPYLVAGSPAARLFDGNYERALPLLFRVGLPSLLLASAVAITLTPMALWMTVVLFLISILGWTTRRTLQSSTTFLQSMVTVSLPWLLVLTLFGTEISDQQWRLHLLLIFFWTLHHWGERRNLRTVGDTLGLILLATAEIGIVALLIFLHAPFWLALLIILWLPTWLSIYYRRPVEHLHFLWLLAMLLSAWALGQNL